MDGLCEQLLNTEPILFDPNKSHVPLNIWKQYNDNRLTLAMIFNKNQGELQLVKSTNLFYFVKEPI